MGDSVFVYGNMLLFPVKPKNFIIRLAWGKTKIREREDGILIHIEEDWYIFVIIDSDIHVKLLLIHDAV